MGVGGHVAVIVQVIAGQVGQRRDIEGHALDPALIEGMGGYLHDHARCAGSAVSGQ